MKSGLILRISADIAMTVILLLLMTYELVGQAAHEKAGLSLSRLIAFMYVIIRSKRAAGGLVHSHGEHL